MKPRTPLTKTTRSQALAAGLLLLLLLLALPAVVQAAGYSYTTSNGQITITGYTGPGGAVVIPTTVDGLPVTSIGDYAFRERTSLTGVTIGNSVTRIGDVAFYGCTSLTNVTIGNSVTTIGSGAFMYCTSLTSVTIPDSVSSIGDRSFSGTGLTGLYFQGQPPADGTPFDWYDQTTTVYYLPWSTGWGTTYGGRPTALWLPRIRTDAASFGVRNSEFGFDVSQAPGKIVVVEAATDLANPVWSPLQTLTLTGDSIHFSDPQWTMQPARFYHLRSP